MVRLPAAKKTIVKKAMETACRILAEKAAAKRPRTGVRKRT
jgi:hypothetical protein